MKFIIRWRNRDFGFGRSLHSLVTGTRVYLSKEEAEAQVNQWKMYFPFNTYYIEPVTVISGKEFN